MSENGFILHGAVVYCKDRESLISMDEAWVVCKDGVSRGVYDHFPEEYAGLEVEDYWDKLIVPGFTDLHVHAPQYQFRGTGMDMELLGWLNTIVFPEESRYKDLEYAESAYDQFIEDLYVGPTTRAVIFGTADVESTLLLMDMLEDTGLITYVGKVNMDRNVPDYYIETTEQSLNDTITFVEGALEEEYERTMPIITPRFTVSCSRELMKGLGEIAREYNLPVQSHISENLTEMRMVRELEPDCSFYGETYEVTGLFGSPSDARHKDTDAPGYGDTIMAHCVWSPMEEIALMKKNGVYIAHCPESNMNLTSGAAPASFYLDKGLHIGLGTDLGAGASPCLFDTMKAALTSSKLRKRYHDETVRSLDFSDVFYMATLGGGEFFGKVGSFENGYEFDAVVLDDFPLSTMNEYGAAERMERMVYLGDDRNVVGKYVRGRKLY